MRRVIVLFGLILMLRTAFAQQRPHYSQYLQNMSVLNPAVTGTYDNIDVRLGVRTQWQGFSGAPKTGYITISTPVSFTCNMDNYRDNAMGVVEPETKEDMINYSSSMSHHSLGAVFLSDKAGPLSRVTANVTYAYHISIGDVTNLSVGVGVGVNRLGIDGESLVFDEKDDAVVGSSAQINKYTPDLNAGVYYYGANFYIGASMQQIIKNRITFDGDFSVGKEVPHYFLAAGYQFWINDDFSLTPSVMLKAVDPLPKAFDVNMKFAYRNTFWIGAGYRKDDAFFGSIGFNVAKMVGVNYAYDYTTSALKTSSSGSHELALRILF